MNRDAASFFPFHLWREMLLMSFTYLVVFFMLQVSASSLDSVDMKTNKKAVAPWTLTREYTVPQGL